MVDENIFFLIFLLVNDHRSDVLVTTNLSGQLKVDNIKPTKTVVTSKIWKTKTSVTVSATDATLVRSPSGKNWQDRDKADKLSISFPATPKDN